MRPRATAAALLMAIFGSVPVAADESLWSRFHIRHNLNTKQEVPQPAFFQITDPKGKESSYAVALGIKFDARDGTLFTLGPFAEYQRNSLIDKEQDVLKGGLAAEWQLRPVDPLHPANPTTNSGVLTSALNYKKDQVAKTESLQLSLMYTRFWVGQVESPKPNHYFSVGKPDDPSVGFLYSPNVGVEVEEISQADVVAKEGTVVRAVADLSLALYPRPNALDDRLELAIRGTYRSDVSDDTNQEDDSHPLVSASLTYYFLRSEEPKRLAGVSVSYTDGEDPANGFEDQEFWLIALKVQMD